MSERLQPLLRTVAVWLAVSIAMGLLCWWIGEHPETLGRESIPARQYVLLAAVVLAVPTVLVAALLRFARRRSTTA
jgi:hypothetical protein